MVTRLFSFLAVYFLFRGRLWDPCRCVGSVLSVDWSAVLCSVEACCVGGGWVPGGGGGGSDVAASIVIWFCKYCPIHGYNQLRQKLILVKEDSENLLWIMAKLQDGVQKWLSRTDPARENIVATFNLNCKLDLKAIASRLIRTQYDPKSFDALIMRLAEPKTTVLLSSSGKAICTGAKTEAEATQAAIVVADTLRSTMGYHVEYLNDYKVEGVSTGIKKLGSEVYTIKDGALVEISKSRMSKRGKRVGVCVPGIPKFVKRLLVTLGLIKHSEANH